MISRPAFLLGNLFILLAGYGSSAKAAALVIQVSGSKSSAGEIGCALYAAARGFPDNARHRMRAPNFQEAAITLKEEQSLRIEIEVGR